MAGAFPPGLARILLVFLPTALFTLYFGFICTPRYVSEARFVIHSASKPAAGLSGLSALLQLAGLSSFQDAAYSVRDFLTSRDALRELEPKVDLLRVYGDSKADFLSRYPSFLYGRSNEDLYRYFQRRISVIVNNTSEMTTLRVEAFHPDDAQAIARTLLDLGEALVNRLNDRVEQDAVRTADDELSRAQEQRVAAQIAVTAFRNRELVLDPGKNAAIVLELIGKLSTELAQTRAQIDETRQASPRSPLLASLTQQASALQQQIDVERDRVTKDSDALADKISAYERLMLEQEFATRALSQAVMALDSARSEARRQQLFLERVVEPDRPDKAMEPQRLRIILTAFGFNVIGAGVLWLIGTGLREHAASGHR